MRECFKFSYQFKKGHMFNRPPWNQIPQPNIKSEARSNFLKISSFDTLLINEIIIINEIFQTLVLTQVFGLAAEKYSPLARIWVLFFPFFGIIHPNDVRTVLSSSKQTDKAFFYKLLQNFLGSGLITSSGEWFNYNS